MKRTTKYVALDVHQATTVTSVREESGRVLARSVLETHGPSIVEFFCGMRGAIHVAFEEGTQSQWLHDLVAPLVDRVVVCDRRGQARQGNKGDHVDADQLSELLRRGGLRHCATRARCPDGPRKAVRRPRRPRDGRTARYEWRNVLRIPPAGPCATAAAKERRARCACRTTGPVQRSRP